MSTTTKEQRSIPIAEDSTPVPPGYKPSDVGLIPSDWNAHPIRDLADIVSGATPSTQVASYWNGTIPWCTPTDITGTRGKYLAATERNISPAGLASCAARQLPVGTLLLCSRATIGEVKIAATEICTNQGLKSLVCKDRVSNEILYYLLLTLKPQMIERAFGSTFLELGKRDLASIQVPLPPPSEQRAIAGALSDVDRLLGTLETLIEKKRAIKQGAMQQLLTGKTRLPGFREGTRSDEQSAVPPGWEVKPFGSISHMHGRIGWQGLSQAEFTSSPEDPFLITGVDFKGTEIDWDAAYHVSRERYDIAPQIQLRPGDVLMTKDGTIGKMLYVGQIPYPGMATGVVPLAVELG